MSNRNRRIWGVGLAAMAIVSIGASAHAQAVTYGTRIKVEVDRNVTPNNDAIPRNSHIVVSWEYMLGMAPLADPCVMEVTSWNIDLGDGTIITNPTITERRTIIDHTYTTAGPKYITVDATFSGGDCVLENAGGRTLVGALTPYDPGLEVDPLVGAIPFNATASLTSFPGDALNEEHWFGFNFTSAYGQEVKFRPSHLSGTFEFEDFGIYSLGWRENDHIVWGTSAVYEFPDTVIAVSATGETSVQPSLGTVSALEDLNTPGTEWNGRMTANEEHLYFLSDWDGTPAIYRAEASEMAPGGYTSPTMFFTPSDGSWIRGFEMNSDASTFLMELGYRSGASSLVMIQGVGLEDLRPIEVVGAQNWLNTWSINPNRSMLNRASLGENGLRLILPNSYVPENESKRLAAYDRDVANQYRFRRNDAVPFKDDQLPRLQSSDGTVRLWRASSNNATSLFDPIYASVDGEAGVSLYTQHGSGTAARYRWSDLDGEGVHTLLDQVSPDGSYALISSDREGAEGSLDLFRAELELPPSHSQQAAIVVDHVTGAKPINNPVNLDLNSDSTVDSGDVQTVP